MFLAVIICSHAGAVDQKPTEALPAMMTKQEMLWQKLTNTISHISRDMDGVIGVAIVDLTDGNQLVIAGDEVFPVASSIKIAILAELYRQSQRPDSHAKLTDLYTMNAADLVDSSAIMAGLTPGVTRVTNRDLAVFMVTVSDNAATNVLIDRVGLDNINRMLENQNLINTRLRRKMIDLDAAKAGRENTSTPREMATLLENIYRCKVLDSSSTADFIRVLSTPKESYIPRYLPEDLQVANKPGSLAGVRSDCGIIFVPRRPFIISVMTTYVGDEKAAEEAIARIAEAAFKYFDIVGASSGYGRILYPRSRM